MQRAQRSSCFLLPGDVQRVLPESRDPGRAPFSKKKNLFWSFGLVLVMGDQEEAGMVHTWDDAVVLPHGSARGTYTAIGIW